MIFEIYQKYFLKYFKWKFFSGILDSLTYLRNWLNSDDENDEITYENMDNNNGDNCVNNDKNHDYDADDDDYDENCNNVDIDVMDCSMKKLPDAINYYQITYLMD